MVLGGLPLSDPHFTLGYLLELRFVQEEIERLAGGALPLTPERVDSLAELFLRLLHSFLSDPGPPRSEAALRAQLSAWLVPLIEK